MKMLFVIQILIGKYHNILMWIETDLFITHVRIDTIIDIQFSDNMTFR
jgi:hypothetical protein